MKKWWCQLFHYKYWVYNIPEPITEKYRVCCLRCGRWWVDGL